MMISLQTYVQQGKRKLWDLLQDPGIHGALRGSVYFVAGFTLSAASLLQEPLPLAMGLTCACSGWAAVLTGLGSAFGYLLFWGTAGQQGILWSLAAALTAVILREPRRKSQMPMLLPALAGLIVSASGVAFQTWFADTTPVLIYLLRVGDRKSVV